MVEEVIQYVIPKLDQFCIKYELQKFDSSAIMIDIWIKDKFYCIQLFGKYRVKFSDRGFWF